ncbi:MAG: class I SAM-dependent methyltransferase [Acidimicrobiales bacterium]|nr:MAG: class I SAM-dependent methyltransferase [Acidimicrobiales bacterium]
MAEKTKSLYRIVTIPVFYEAIQIILGRDKARKHLREHYLQTKKGDKVLEVGCGPGSLLPLLGDVDYLGMDLNPVHIEKAKQSNGDKGTFICGNAVTEVEHAAGPFDLIICIGLLHHLNDDEAASMIGALSKRLSQNGRFVSLDPTYIDKQNCIAKKLADLDSGQNIRTQSAYASLFPSTKFNLDSRELSGLLNIPYNHCLNVLTPA